MSDECPATKNVVKVDARDRTGFSGQEPSKSSVFKTKRGCLESGEKLEGNI
jgi:hypothetical protein